MPWKWSTSCGLIATTTQNSFFGIGRKPNILLPPGQNIALQLDATADISLLDPICTRHGSLADVSLSLGRKRTNGTSGKL